MKTLARPAAVYGIFFLALVALLVIVRPFGLYFLNDDFIHIPEAIKGNFFHTNLLRPVADLSLWIDGKIWGLNAGGFHLTNLLLHLVNCLLAYQFYRRFLTRRGATMIIEKSLLGVSLFIIYGFHSESLFWIIGRGGPLAAFFMLVALNAYLISDSRISLFIALGFFGAGLFAYEFTWVTPVLILALQLVDRRSRKVRWYWTVSFAGFFLAYLIFRSVTHVGVFGSYESGALAGFHIKVVAYNFCAGLARTFIPPVSRSSLFVVAAVVGLAGAVSAFFFLWRRKRMEFLLCFFPAVCMLVSLLPLVNNGVDIHDSESERFLYVPSVFACWLMVELVFAIIPAAGFRRILVLIVVVAHMFILYRSSRAYYFASTVTKISLSCLKKLPKGRRLAAMDLPSQYRGALIFRSGFSSALRWLLPGHFDSISVQSYQELKMERNFNCIQEKVSGSPRSLDLAPDEVGCMWTDRSIILFDQ